MLDFRIAGRYARSLFDLSLERGEMEKLHDEFQSLSLMLSGSRELRDVLKSPIIPTDKKKAILHELLDAEMGTLGLTFVDIVVHKRRASHLRAIALELHRLYNEHRGIVPARVRSAKKLTEEQIKTIINILKADTKKDIELKTKVDPALLGGLIVSIGDRQIDASVSKQLRDLRKEFKENPYQIKY